MDFITTWHSIKMLFTKKLTKKCVFCKFLYLLYFISFHQKKCATTQYTCLKRRKNVNECKLLL